MGTATERLRRLVADDVGDCCDGDAQARLDELHALEAATPDESDRDQDTDALRTLGDDTRYRLARLVVAADRPLCVCELTPLVAVSDSAVSHALSDLTEAGLVVPEREGTWRYYRPTERAERLIAALDATRGKR